MKRFAQFMERYDFRDQGIAVAVSGGADSMAMLVMLLDWLKSSGRFDHAKVVVLTVDHKTREDSYKDNDFVLDFCKSIGCQAYLLGESVPPWNGDGSMAVYCRKLRYKLIVDFCRQNSIHNILIAHHKDDQIETFFINMMRGSGLDGLASIPRVKMINNIRLIRPMLGFTKCELADYLRSKGISWCEDPTNEFHLRGECRRALRAFPQLERERITRTIEHLQRAREALGHYVELAFKASVKSDERGCFVIDANQFDNLVPEVALRLLIVALRLIGGRLVKPRYSALMAVFEKVYHGSSKSFFTLGGCVIVRMGQQLWILREIVAIQGDIRLELGAEVIWDNRFRFVLESKSSGLGEIFLGGPFVRRDFKLKFSAVEDYIDLATPVIKNSDGVVVAAVLDAQPFQGGKGLVCDCRFRAQELLLQAIQGGIL